MSAEKRSNEPAGDLGSLTDHAVDLVGRLPGHVNRVRVASGGSEIEVEWASAAPPAAAVAPAAPSVTPPPAGVPAADAAPPQATAEAGAQAGLVSVSSPVVGVFYDRPSPDDPPFVAVGDRVSVGEQVAIVEAMKLMNPILADVAGEVVAIRAAAGEAVQFDQPLIDIRPLEG